MIKLSFWDWVAYICLAVLIAYFLLKILNIISSPLEFDILALISASYLIGRYAMKIDIMFKEVESIKRHCRVCR